MNVSNRNWRPHWPVVPPRLWLTAAAAAVVGLGLGLQQEIWPHHPRAEPWGWLALGLLTQAGGIGLIKVLWGWLGEYRGPRWVQLVMACGVLPVCLAGVLLLIGTCLLTCFWLINVLTR